MKIQMSEHDLQNVLKAYQTLQLLSEKVISPNELYCSEFFQGLEESISDVNSGKTKEVTTFEKFLA